MADSPPAAPAEEGPAPLSSKPKEVLIHGLVILPPRQHEQHGDDDSTGVALPPLRCEEAVASLRGALCEIVGFAHLTKFRLVIERLGGSDVTKKSNKSDPLDPSISRYTLQHAVVSVPPSIKTLESIDNQQQGEPSEIVLDDYGDLSVLADVIEPDEAKGDDSKIVLDAKGRCAVRIVLERYDLAAVRDQIGRVRSLRAGNAPALKTLLLEEDHVNGTAVDRIIVDADQQDKEENKDAQVQAKVSSSCCY
jgi:protein TIF31